MNGGRHYFYACAYARAVLGCTPSGHSCSIEVPRCSYARARPVIGPTSYCAVAKHALHSRRAIIDVWGNISSPRSSDFEAGDAGSGER